MEKIKQRESNIELLRITLMIMIVLIHYLFRGCNLRPMIFGQYTFDSNSPYLLLLFTFVIASVNCFVFISGYFSIKLKANNTISFILQALAYSILNFIIAYLFLFDNPNFNINILETLFPISSNHWWFLNIYLGLSLFSPIINKGTEYLTKVQFKIILFALLYLQTSYLFFGINFLSTTGQSIYSMLVMYLLGRYFRIYDVKIKKPFILFTLLSFFLFLLFYFTIKYGNQGMAWRMVSYNSIFIVAASIFFFYSFKNMKIKYIPFINKVAALSFGVYLFHESSSVRFIISKIPKHLSSWTNNPVIIILLLVILSICTFIVGITIEKLRVLISQPILNIISKQIEKVRLK